MSEPTKEEIADCIDKAHDVLLIGGWCQQWLETSTGEHCVMGAVALAANLRDRRGDLMYPDTDSGVAWSAQKALNNLTWTADAVNLVSWNDEEGRTIDDVLDLMRHASKELRS